MTVVTLGDSITAVGNCDAQDRWPELLRRRLAEGGPGRTVQVLNAGVGGNTSREGLARLDRDVLAHRPDIVTVEFGGNDATPESARHVELPEFRANITAICRRIRDAGAIPVLLTFPPIIDEQHCWGGLFRERGGPDAGVEDYRAAMRDLARELDCGLVDIDRAVRRVMATEGRGAAIVSDGVHLTPRGNEVIADEVFQGLDSLLPGGRADGGNPISWESASGEATRAWLAWNRDVLTVCVRCEFRGELPRDTDAIELYAADARCEDSLIRIAVNATGTLIVMGGGQIVPQPKWGYWHHKPLELGVTARVTYAQDAWEAQLTVPLAVLGIPAVPGGVIPLHLVRGEHRGTFGYPNCGCAPGVQRRFWPLGPSFDPLLPVFYPRLLLRDSGALAPVPAAATPAPAPSTFAFRGFQLDQSRGALKFSPTYLCRLAERLRSWGVDQFMIYTEGEFAPAAYPMLKKDDAYDAAEFRQLGRALAAGGSELVPCHAALGHLDRALSTPGLTHLKENGQEYQLCLAQPESYEFLGQIIDELCADRAGTFFHANTDESVMLGWCPDCQELMAAAGGYGALLLRHLLWLRERVGRHGRRLMIWADMVLRLPSVLEALPRDVVLADWEYDDFGTYPALAYLRGKGFDVLACPWMTFANHRSYSRAARAAGVTGFLQTCWTRGNKSLGETWPAIYHGSRLFCQPEAVASVAIWKDWERLLGASGSSAPLPWENLAAAIADEGTLSPGLKQAYCRAFLEAWPRFDAQGPWADVLHELRRELLIQSWRLALAGHGGTTPSVAEVEALAAAETAFRREAVHATATPQDPRLTELLAQVGNRPGTGAPER